MEYVFLAKLYIFALRFEDDDFASALYKVFRLKIEECGDTESGTLPGVNCIEHLRAWENSGNENTSFDALPDDPALFLMVYAYAQEENHAAFRDLHHKEVDLTFKLWVGGCLAYDDHMKAAETVTQVA